MCFLSTLTYRNFLFVFPFSFLNSLIICTHFINIIIHKFVDNILYYFILFRMYILAKYCSTDNESSCFYLAKFIYSYK